MINKLKTNILKCVNHSVYEYDSLTLQELVCDFFTKLNECIDITNKNTDDVDYLLDEGLEKELLVILDMWLKGGKLNEILTNNTFSELSKIVNDNKKLLENKANINDVVLKGRATLNDFDYDTKQAILGGQYNLNFVLGENSVDSYNIKNNSITYEKLDFFNTYTSLNRLDLSKVKNGVTVSANNGTIYDHDDGCISDYIKVSGGDIIRTNSPWEGAFYDKDKNFIIGKQFNEYEITAPSNAKYYRQGIKLSTLYTIMITINSELPLEYQNFTSYYDLSDDFKNRIHGVFDDYKVLSSQLEFLQVGSDNIFNNKDIKHGFIISDTDGTLVSHETGVVSNFIKVQGNTKLYCSHNWNGGFYDINKNFITNKPFGETEFTTPSNCYYIRMSLSKEWINTYMLSLYPINSYVAFDDGIRIRRDEDLLSLSSQLLSTGMFNGNHTPNKKWTVIGDSLTEKNNRATKNYHDYITGYNVVNLGLSGTGYMRTNENNTAFYQRVNQIPLDTDIITIFGSGNDLSLISSLGNPTDETTSTLCGCMNETIKLIFKRLPHVKLGIISPCPWGAYPTFTANNMKNYAQAMEQVCKRWGVPYLDLYHSSNMRPWDNVFKNMFYKRDDGNSVHPDEDGHKLLSTRIGSFLKSL